MVPSCKTKARRCCANVWNGSGGGATGYVAVEPELQQAGPSRESVGGRRQEETNGHRNAMGP